MVTNGRFSTMFRRTVLLALLAALLAACGGADPTATTGSGTSPTAAPAGGAPFTIGVSNGFVSSEWRTQMLEDLQAVNKEYMAQGLTKELIIESADTDVAGQEQQIRNLINKGVNAIIINPNSVNALDSVIKEAKTAGIIVIAIDQEIPTPDAINVVIDQVEWARMSADWLAKELGGKGNVVVINGIAGHPANEARYSGVKEVFAKYPDIKIVNEANANWDQATGQQKMSELLASQTDIDGVWTQDGMAFGVLQALVAAKPAKWPINVGEARAGYMQLWDATLKTNPEFKSYGVVNPPGVAASGLRVAVELLQGRKFKDGTLKGPGNNSLYVPIPGFVSPENFAAEFAKIAGKPASYVGDGTITLDQAKAYFQ